jgi:hypothetical protein
MSPIGRVKRRGLPCIEKPADQLTADQAVRPRSAPIRTPLRAEIFFAKIPLQSSPMHYLGSPIRAIG